jgi:hypothetical protein
VQALVDTIQSYMAQDGETNPAIIARALQLRYKPSTALTYVQTHQANHPELRNDPRWRIARRSLTTVAARSTKFHAPPLDPHEVRLLIGNLQTPLQRAIFQAWVAAARSTEMQSHQDEENLRIRHSWRVVKWTSEHVVELYMPTSKGSVLGKHPYSKWIRVPRHLPLSVWDPQHVSYEQMNDYVKTIFPGHTFYSLKQGAIRQLDRRFSAQQIAKLTGHTSRAQVQSLNTSYLPRHPQQQEALEVMEMTTYLQTLIL